MPDIHYVHSVGVLNKKRKKQLNPTVSDPQGHAISSIFHGLRKVLQEGNRCGLNLFRFNPKATCFHPLASFFNPRITAWKERRN
jgi:hypothetical protein